jgi:3D-(3,5/4)-trihydroxycyclohexane-1,2-dione acylhydrolase (decyclizing)
VLQQVEHFDVPSTTVNDAFRAVSRYWDRIVRPEQILQSLPQAVATMLDPADCGPAFLGLAQDAQGEAFDYPEIFFEPVLHRIRRPRPDRAQLAAAAKVLAGARRPLIIAGGGVHYSLAESELAQFAERRGIPVVETIAGRGVLIHDHAANAGPLGVIGSSSANALAAEADVVLAIGTRLQDFTTGSWTVFASPQFQLIALNAARFDAVKHRSISLVGDAREGMAELDAALASYRAPQSWMDKARVLYAEWNAVIEKATTPGATASPTYAQVVGAVNRKAGARDRVLTASGGFPGELVKNWKVKSVGTFDCEFGFSCMGYEIAGGWGAKMATPEAEVIVLVGDGAYLMMNSDIYSSVLTGHKMIVVVCDNGGYAVINRLQNYKGGASFNNLIKDCRVAQHAEVDFARHAQSMGAVAETVTSIAELEQAMERARAAPRTAVIVIKIDAFTWTAGDAWWDVGVPEVSAREEVRKAAAEHALGKKKQRLGV